MVRPLEFMPRYPFFQPRLGLEDPYPQQPFELTLPSKSEIRSAAEAADGLFGQQRLIAQYLSDETPYRSVLLYHAPGTGKTCTAVRVAERARQEGRLRGALVMARGVTLLRNFLQELVFGCQTQGRYLPERYEHLSDLEKTTRVRKLTSTFYRFLTYETFAKRLAELSDAQIRLRYNGHVMIMDEIHHVRKGTPTYAQLLRLCQVTRNCKRVLMSGTPMANLPVEFAHIMQLLLPPELDIEVAFDQQGNLREEAGPWLQQQVRGYVSYLRAPEPGPGLAFVGELPPQPPLQHVQVVRLRMSSFQSQLYTQAVFQDSREHNIFINSRQAALGVLPSGVYGARVDSRRQELQTIANQLDEFSCKYAYVVRVLESSPKSFVFCEFVNGSGLLFLAGLLEARGWTRATGKERSRGRRFAVMATGQKHLQATLQRFNAADNINGGFISAVLGSRVVAEGVTFKDVRHSIIVAPSWNYTETAQAIARCWRVGSHSNLRARGASLPLLQVHQLAAISEIGDSIDLDMYTVSEAKDREIKRVEQLVKAAALDCALFQDKNSHGQNYSRDCNYALCQTPCLQNATRDLPVEPAALPNAPLDASTHQLLSQHRAVAWLREQGWVSVVSALVAGLSSTTRETLAVLWSLAADATVVRDRLGAQAVVRLVNADTLTLVPVNQQLPRSLLDDHYTRNTVATMPQSSSQLLLRWERRRLPTQVAQLFQQNNEHSVYEIAANLPIQAQQLLLMACVASAVQGLRQNAWVRDMLLNFYQGFYQMDGPEGPIVWLYKEEFGVQLWQGQAWQLAGPLTLQALEERRRFLLASPVGLYGLYNPYLKDFCIRDVSLGVEQGDLRRLTVGRRCVDWDLTTLLDIVIRRMKIAPPPEFLEQFSAQQLQEAALQDPLHTPADLEDGEASRRFLFWTQKGNARFRRSDLCRFIEAWFRQRGLLENNFDCGHQRKRRGRFA